MIYYMLLVHVNRSSFLLIFSSCAVTKCGFLNRCAYLQLYIDILNGQTTSLTLYYSGEILCLLCCVIDYLDPSKVTDY